MFQRSRSSKNFSGGISSVSKVRTDPGRTGRDEKAFKTEHRRPNHDTLHGKTRREKIERLHGQAVYTGRIRFRQSVSNNAAVLRDHLSINKSC